jgi:ATP-binding cassette subfamily B (MDR/TAP) protein 1
VSAFVHVPRLAGVLFALIPFTMAIFIGVGWWTEAIVVKRVPIDGQLSSFTEQLLSSIRIVHSFDMGKPLLLKLEHSMLKPLRRLTRKIALVKALEQASAYGAGFLVYSLAFWYGSIEVTKGAEVGDVLTVSPCVLIFIDQLTHPLHRHSTTTSTCSLDSLPWFPISSLLRAPSRQSVLSDCR